MKSRRAWLVLPALLIAAVAGCGNDRVFGQQERAGVPLRRPAVVMQPIRSGVAGSAPFVSGFSQAMLSAHDTARAARGMPALAYDASLGTGALAHAQWLAATDRFEHSAERQRPGQGENLWAGTRGAYALREMVDYWTEEATDFVPGRFPYVSRTGSWHDVGHYTQIIWPGTTRVGCGMASNGRRDFLVCRYAPAGNVMGRPLP